MAMPNAWRDYLAADRLRSAGHAGGPVPFGTPMKAIGEVAPEFTFPNSPIRIPEGFLHFDRQLSGAEVDRLRNRHCPHCGRKMDHQGRIVMGLLAIATIAAAIAVIQFIALVDHGIIRL